MQKTIEEAEKALDELEIAFQDLNKFLLPVLSQKPPVSLVPPATNDIVISNEMSPINKRIYDLKERILSLKNSIIGTAGRIDL